MPSPGGRQVPAGAFHEAQGRSGESTPGAGAPRPQSFPRLWCRNPPRARIIAHHRHVGTGQVAEFFPAPRPADARKRPGPRPQFSPAHRVACCIPRARGDEPAFFPGAQGAWPVMGPLTLVHFSPDAEDGPPLQAQRQRHAFNPPRAQESPQAGMQAHPADIILRAEGPGLECKASGFRRSFLPQSRPGDVLPRLAKRKKRLAMPEEKAYKKPPSLTHRVHDG